VNGVAHTSRHFEGFARRRDLPFLCVRAGDRARAVMEEGNVWTLELPRGFLSFVLEKDLRLDPAFFRHIPLIGEVLQRFQPDLIHITGPSEIGILARAWRTTCTCACSELAHQRSRIRGATAEWFLRLLPKHQSTATGHAIENWQWQRGPVLLHGASAVRAESELCALLERNTGRPAI